MMRLLALIVAVSGAAAAAGQPAGRPRSDQAGHSGEAADIVVTGRRAKAESTVSQTRAVSMVHDGQLARFEVPVCPIVLGLQPSHSASVVARIRATALQAGVRVARPGCAPNMTVVIADDGAAFVDRLHKKRRLLFETLQRRDRDGLLNSTGPVWSWQSISPKRRDGGPVEAISQIQIGAGAPQHVAGRAYVVRNAELSRLSVPVRQDTDLSFVILEAGKLDGLTLRQIADYAAIVGLAAIRAEKADEIFRATILTLFRDRENGRTPQPNATAFDIAYLQGLYSGQSGYSSDQKARMIAQRIDRADATSASRNPDRSN